MRIVYIIAFLVICATTMGTIDKLFLETPSFFPKDLEEDFSNAPSKDSKLFVQNRSYTFVTKLARKFGIKYFKNLTLFSPETRVSSPLNIFLTLSMMYYGARGPTMKNLERVIGLSRVNRTFSQRGYQTLVDTFYSHRGTGLHFATKLYFCNGLIPEAKFLNVATNYFRVVMEYMKNNDGYKMREKVNNWIATNTNNRSTQIFHMHELDRKPNIILASIVYINGNWISGFDKSLTEPRPFYVFGAGKIKVPTMNRHGIYRYGRLDELDARFIEIPYKINRQPYGISMFIILPNQLSGYRRLINNMKYKVLKNIYKGVPTNVNLYLPKFRIESRISLSDTVRQMTGLHKAFDSDADFTRIMYSKNLSIAETPNTVIFEIDEEGGISSGATGGVYQTRTIRSHNSKTTVDFIADHPFIAIVATTGKIHYFLLLVNFTGSNFEGAESSMWSR